MVLTAIAKRALAQSLTFGILSFSWILSMTGLVQRQLRLLYDCVPKFFEQVGTTTPECLSVPPCPADGEAAETKRSEREMIEEWGARQADNHGSWELVPRPITSRGNASPCFIIISKLFLPIGERFVSLVLRTLAALQGSRCCPPGCRLQQLTRRGAAGERADRLITPDIFTVKSIARTF